MIGEVKTINGVKTVVPLSGQVSTDRVESGNMQSVTSNAVSQALSTNVQTGSVIQFACDVPEGYLDCTDDGTPTVLPSLSNKATVSGISEIRKLFKGGNYYYICTDNGVYRSASSSASTPATSYSRQQFTPQKTIFDCIPANNFSSAMCTDSGVYNGNTQYDSSRYYYKVLFFNGRYSIYNGSGTTQAGMLFGTEAGVKYITNNTNVNTTPSNLMLSDYEVYNMFIADGEGYSSDPYHMFYMTDNGIFYDNTRLSGTVNYFFLASREIGNYIYAIGHEDENKRNIQFFKIDKSTKTVVEQKRVKGLDGFISVPFIYDIFYDSSLGFVIVGDSVVATTDSFDNPVRNLKTLVDPASYFLYSDNTGLYTATGNVIQKIITTSITGYKILSKTDYANLYAKVGDRYPVSGLASNEFAIPLITDSTNRFRYGIKL